MGSTTFTIPSDIASGQSIQLSYPITSVQKPTNDGNDNTVFYLMTPGVTFNMAYIDSVKSRSLSGYSSKAIIHKPFHLPKESNAELCIVHQKTNSNDNFYLAIPLKNNPNAKSNLSAYLNSDNDIYKLDIGSDIAGSDIVYYQNKNSKDVFVVVNPVEVNIPNNITLSETPTFYSDPKNEIARIKTTSTNDEIVCDYEGDITEDANKSSETKEAEMNMFWANVVPVIIVGVVYLLCMQINASSIEPKSILIGYVVLAILFGIVAIVFSALIKKTDSKRVNYYGIYAATSWLLFLLFAVFAVLKVNSQV